MNAQTPGTILFSLVSLFLAALVITCSSEDSSTVTPLPASSPFLPASPSGEKLVSATRTETMGGSILGTIYYVYGPDNHIMTVTDDDGFSVVTVLSYTYNAGGYLTMIEVKNRTNQCGTDLGDTYLSLRKVRAFDGTNRIISMDEIQYWGTSTVPSIGYTHLTFTMNAWNAGGNPVTGLVSYFKDTDGDDNCGATYSAGANGTADITDDSLTGTIDATWDSRGRLTGQTVTRDIVGTPTVILDVDFNYNDAAGTLTWTSSEWNGTILALRERKIFTYQEGKVVSMVFTKYDNATGNRKKVESNTSLYSVDGSRVLSTRMETTEYDPLDGITVTGTEDTTVTYTYAGATGTTWYPAPWQIVVEQPTE